MTKSRTRWWIAATAVLLAIVVIGIVARRPNRFSNGPDVSREDLFKKAVETVAAAEDARYEQAIQGWSFLLEHRPNDESLLLNQAITALKWIDETSGLLNSGVVSEEQQLERKAELAKALAEADRIITLLSRSSADNGRKAYLESAVLEAKSRQLAFPEDSAVRLQAANRLGEALVQDPAQALLACKLDDLSQELSGDNEQLAKTTADALLASWKALPRNLYLLVRAGELLLERQDAKLVELLDPSLELAQPMMSMLERSLSQRKPADIVALAKQAISGNQWNNAQQLRLWFNVLKSSTAYRPDMRAVKPDIMALLNTDFLQQWRDEHSPAAIEPTAAALEPAFNSLAIPLPEGASPATIVQWYDFDVDAMFELLVAGGQELRLFKWDSELSQPAEAQKIDLPSKIHGMRAVDLFEVDSTSRPRIIQSVAERAADPSAAPAADLADESRSNQHDTIQELIVWHEAGVAVVTSRESAPGTGTRTLELISEVDGLSTLRGVRQVEPLDMDSDGDLDLFVTTGGGMHFLQNNGNRTFQDVSQYSSLPVAGWLPEQVVACDYDRDLDIDVVCVSKSAPFVAVLENILHNQFRLSQFRLSGLESGALPQGAALTGLSVAELDGNGSWDWCLLGENAIGSIFTRTADDHNVVVVRRNSVPLASPLSFELADVNNDAFVDAIVARSNGLDVHFGTVDGSFIAKPHGLPSRGAVTSIDCLDANQDGSIEIAAIVDGRPVLLRQTEKPSGGFVEARLRGINDVNGGGRINHYAVGSVVELWSNDRFQAQVVRKPAVHFGLGGQTPINLRVVFNNGLTQNVESVKADTLVMERQELKGSCPFVYGWDGMRYQLITDLLWNAPLGLQVARGQVLPDRRWEYLVLPGELVQPVDGAYELRVTEELWEIAYFDHIALTAVDHPSDVEIFNNEKVGPAEIAEPKLFHVTEKVYPVRALDSYGRDSRAKLARRDKVYVQAFDKQICQGLAEPHFIELEFAETPPPGAKLFLTGWLHPTDTSLNIALDQNKDLPAPEPPSLWVASENNEFRCVRPFMGFPGGKPKSIAVDLQGVFAPRERRLRIASSQQIYWDEAFVSEEEARVASQARQLELKSATFGFRGFGQLQQRSPDQPHWYDYNAVSTVPKWPPLDGPFTRYGDVAELIRKNDDKMVIMGSGDEMVLRFAVPSQLLPNGWKRDFVMHNVGWDKDADLNTLAGESSVPLPFASMESYPPPATQAAEAQRVWELNAPTLVNRQSSARFWKTRRINQK